jgi:antitoxin (DNA-binding transcriptional repressor) of toxin-antitoxin stability system
MKRFTTATAKQRFSLLLDAAERGESVIIERRGVRFRLRPERQTTSKKTRRKPVIEIVDPAVAKGVWQWQWRAEGLRFSRNQENGVDLARYQRFNLVPGAPPTQPTIVTLEGPSLHLARELT